MHLCTEYRDRKAKAVSCKLLNNKWIFRYSISGPTLVNLENIIGLKDKYQVRISNVNKCPTKESYK